MSESVEFVIPRHAVASDPVSGFSALQHVMIEDPRPVRILSAPTGAGKSWAFQKVMRERGARVLFVVPTRRLAQNLREGLIADLVRDGMPEAGALARVSLWTSDERARQEAEGARVRDLRLRQARAEEGQMILATPESVAWYLLDPRRRAGAVNPEMIQDLLAFDHVVFDEFHTIEARGMGLSCAIATLVAQLRDAARVTFLSATPIDVRTTLVNFGIPEEAILVDAEAVTTGTAAETPGLRALHGDVRVRIENGEGLLPALERHRDLVLSTLARRDSGDQVVLVYDSVRQLLADKPALAAWLDGVGVDATQRLAVNSADDSVAREDGLFAIGREAEPGAFRVLVATSSIEMGVTFRAGLMIMEPGHDATSFVQRIGRVARGDLPGEVVVVASPTRRDRNAWLRRLLQVLPGEGGTVPVDRLVELVLGALGERFEASAAELEQQDGTFRWMPQAAAWCAGLFWAALERGALYKDAGSIRAFAPTQARAIGGWIGTLERIRLDSAKRWVRAALAEARRLRMILPKVRVVDPSGAAKSYPWTLYDGTPWLARMPSTVKEKGDLEVRVDVPLAEVEQRLGGRRSIPRQEALMPHLRNTRTLELTGIREAWLRGVEADLDAIDLRPEAREAIEAARRIVRLTGIVPTAESVEAAQDATGIL